MHPTIKSLCSALDMLQLAEQAFARGEAIDLQDFHRRQQAVMSAAKAARPALECLKAGVKTVERQAVAIARGTWDRARLEEVACG